MGQVIRWSQEHGSAAGLKMLMLKAPAKINLVLEVTGKRQDGFHEIKSIIQEIGLYDELSFEKGHEIKFFCDPDILPEDNLVTRAAFLLKSTLRYKQGAVIRMKKNIPLSSGLGGGSSDAAAVLLGLNELWKLELTEKMLLEFAEKLGSDVPFFIRRGIAMAEGRGEKINQLPAVGHYSVVLMLPGGNPLENKTAAMYSRLIPEDFSDGHRALKMADDIKSGNGIDFSLLFNAFERASIELFPYLASGFVMFRTAGADNVHLAGSGPALYSLSSDENSAARLLKNLKKVQGSGNYILCQFAG